MFKNVMILLIGTFNIYKKKYVYRVMLRLNKLLSSKQIYTEQIEET